MDTWREGSSSALLPTSGHDLYLLHPQALSQRHPPSKGLGFVNAKDSFLSKVGHKSALKHTREIFLCEVTQGRQ
jgi:hypothetical protein